MKQARSGSFWSMLDELVRARTGLTAQRLDVAARERLIALAMKRARASDESEYLALLRRDARVFDALIADLTVPETYFFRDPPHFLLLREQVLPAIVRAREPSHVLELWSAGCASGEEAYSLAMLLEQLLLHKRARVLGTDVSPRVLERARRAIYGSWSLRATDPTDIERYFEVVGREYRLRARIRERVSFEQQSLTSPIYPKPTTNLRGFDLILCRNVLIYFDPSAAAAVGERLALSLAPDGYLMMGPSDPLLEIGALCELVRFPESIMYRRLRPGVQAQRAFAPARPRLSRLDAKGAPERAEVPVARVREPDDGARRAVPSATEAAGTTPAALAEPSRGAAATAAIDQVHEIARTHGLAAAEMACRDLLTSTPLAPELHFLHASLLVDLGRAQEAETALRRALYLDRDLLVAHMLYATLLAQRGEREAARRAYERLATRASELPPEQPVPLGEGLTYEAVATLAEQRAAAMAKENAQ